MTHYLTNFYMRNIGFILILTSVVWGAATLRAEANISGFMQGLYGGKADRNNPTQSDLIASEGRLQLRLESYDEKVEFFGRADFVYDDFYKPKSEFELREGYMKFSLGTHLDFKVGRQIITWGTGDLIFINDLFAKDYESFFIGRDDQYLKAPHNALRGTLYAAGANLSLVYSPRFTPNRIPTGERLSYFNPMSGSIVGGDSAILDIPLPSAEFKNGEFAFRLSKYFGSTDAALYGYHGFFKNPEGFDPGAMAPFYPRLNVVGASVRTPVLQGIAWLEAGWYDSHDDPSGKNMFVPNSSFSALIGFERQIAANLTANLQYQQERMLKYDEYVSSLPMGADKTDEVYHLFTSRITKRLLMETLTLSSFVFYSPSAEDFYGRFSIEYKYTDALSLALGANIFDGTDPSTDFGAFALNDNVFLKLTYGY